MALDLSPREDSSVELALAQARADGEIPVPEPAGFSTPARTKATKHARPASSDDVSMEEDKAPAPQRARIAQPIGGTTIDILENPLQLKITPKNFAGEVEEGSKVILLMDPRGDLTEKLPKIIAILKARTTPLDWAVLLRDFALDGVTVPLLQTGTHTALYIGQLEKPAIEFTLTKNDTELDYAMCLQIFDRDMSTNAVRLRTAPQRWPRSFNDTHHLISQDNFVYDVNSISDAVYVPAPSVWCSLSPILPMAILQKALANSEQVIGDFKQHARQKLMDLRNRTQRLRLDIDDFYAQFGCTAWLGALCLCDKVACTVQHKLCTLVVKKH